MINEKLKSILLIEEEEEFTNKLLEISKEYLTNIDLWTNELIEHYLKISGLSREQFIDGFSNNPPMDEF